MSVEAKVLNCDFSCEIHRSLKGKMFHCISTFVVENSGPSYTILDYRGSDVEFFVVLHSELEIMTITHDKKID